MTQSFTRSGVAFRYPVDWAFNIEDTTDGGWTATLQSPGTAFIVISLCPEANDPAQLADQAFEALRNEYEELDAESVVETFAGRPAIGHDLDFLTVDTAITCRTRCVDTPTGPMLVLCQTSEFDRTTNDPILRDICASFEIDPDA